MYERADSFRAQIGNLELIVGLYNDIQRTMMPVEKPLIQGKLDTVDAALRKGLQVRPGYGLMLGHPHIVGNELQQMSQAKSGIRRQGMPMPCCFSSLSPQAIRLMPSHLPMMPSSLRIGAFGLTQTFRSVDAQNLTDASYLPGYKHIINVLLRPHSCYNAY